MKFSGSTCGFCFFSPKIYLTIKVFFHKKLLASHLGGPMGTTKAPKPLCGFRDGPRASRMESSTVVHAHVTAAGHFLDGKVKIELNHRRRLQISWDHVRLQYVTGFQMMCFLDVFGIYMGVSLNLWYPHFTSQVLIICSRSLPHGFVGEIHQPLGHPNTWKTSHSCLKKWYTKFSRYTSLHGNSAGH